MDILKKILSQIKGKTEACPEFAPYHKRLLAAFLETYPDKNLYFKEEFAIKILTQGKYVFGGPDIEPYPTGYFVDPGNGSVRRRLTSIEKYSPDKYCDSVSKIIKCVEKASKSNSKSTKRKTLTMLEEMIRDGRNFVEMGTGTYVQTLKEYKTFFSKVDMSKRQEFVSKVMPLLVDLKERLN